MGTPIPELDECATTPHPVVVARLRRRLAERQRLDIHMAGYRPAAVAVMLLERGGTTWVPLTLRSLELRAHSGQVSLPGGVSEPGDRSAYDTAVRETHEELGIPGDLLVPMGLGDDEPTSSGFIITPVLFELKARPRYQPDPAEVADVFEAPLETFADHTRAAFKGQRVLAGKVCPIRVYGYGDFEIHGATARILEGVNRLLR